MAKRPAIDPLDLSSAEIAKQRRQIIWIMMRCGKSHASASASADRWERSLRRTQLAFIGT